MTETFPYIRAWGAQLGMSANTIDDMLEIARATDAPPDAVYRTKDGWKTISTVPATVQQRVRDQYAKMMAPSRDPSDSVFRPTPASRIREILEGN